MQNSIVALQAAGGDCTGNTLPTSGGYNIASGTSCGFTGTGDLQNVTSGSLALGGLASNGGPTQTRALGFGSVALDHIPVGALEANGCGVTVTTDQRGLPRAGGAGAGGPACDVGAYEAQTPPLAVTLASFDAQAMVRSHPADLGDGQRDQQQRVQPVSQRLAGSAGRAARLRAFAGARLDAGRVLQL